MSSQSSGAQASPKISVLLPRGETLRNFVYSRTLERIAEQATIELQAAWVGDAAWKVLEEHPGDLARLVDHRPGLTAGRLQDLLDLAHGRWLWSKAAQERFRLRDQDANTLGQKSKRMTKKALARLLAHQPGLRLIESLENRASHRSRHVNPYYLHYSKHRPDLVFNASHVHSKNAAPAVQAARWLGIPTATFLFSWDNLTSQGRVFPRYDHFLVWNPAIGQQLLELYPQIEERQVTVTGTPQFDHHFDPQSEWTREFFCRQVGADQQRPIVLYTTGMANHMPAEDRLVENLADDLLQTPSTRDCQLLVRVYPKDRSGRFDHLAARRKDILFQEVPWSPEALTPLPADGPLWSNTLRHCAIGVNVASTVSLELAMFSKPVINIAFNPAEVPVKELSYARYYNFDHYRPLVEQGVVELASSREELVEMTAAALEQPDCALADQQRFLDRMFPSTLDGKSHQRVADCLLTLVTKHHAGTKNEPVRQVA